MKLYLLTLFFLVALAISSGYSQNAKRGVEDFVAFADSVNVLYPVEKVHLHLDKPFYAAGQTIWFKAYVVDGANQPSTRSGILYVDLINDQRMVRKRLKLPLSVGLGWGDIALPDTLAAGNYRLRAYTQWMRNFGEESFYDHAFYVVNSFKEGKANQVVTREGGTSVQFFAEGGQQVEGVRSRIAVKAVGPTGIGVDVSGYVQDNAGTRVAEFKTEYGGMGSFLLTPFEGQTYKAVIALPEGEKELPLPVAAKAGYVISITANDEEKIIARITGSPAAVTDNKSLSLVIQGPDGTVSQLSFKMTRQFADVTIPKADLKTGINQLTLFDKVDRPAAERLVFINKGDQLFLHPASDKASYSRREKVKMDIKPSTFDNTGVTGSFSVSVTDMNRVKVDEHKESTIYSELLLKSELKGFVERPNYYFSGGTDSVKLKQRHLDNLLLTQGWRRLSWEQEKPQLKYPAERNMAISGLVTRGGSPVSGGQITAFTPDGGVSMDTITDSKGRFNFDKLMFADSTRFVIQGRTEKAKANVQIKLDQVPSQEISMDLFNAEKQEGIPANMQSYVNDVKEELSELLQQGLLTRTNVLDEVVVQAVRDPKKLENSSKLGNTPADYAFRADQLSDMNLGQALQGKILGYNLYYDPSTGKTTAGLARNAMVSGVPPMQLFVDGVQWGPNLEKVNMADVAYVEVLKGSGPGAAIYGGRGAAGVIVVTTKVYAGISPANVQVDAQGIVKYLPQGYTVTRSFYSPDYDAPDTKKDIADFRTTLYWNPDLFSKTGESIPVEFFTSDKPGTYRAVVEGIDNKGRIGRGVYLFEVR